MTLKALTLTLTSGWKYLKSAKRFCKDITYSSKEKTPISHLMLLQKILSGIIVYY